MPLMNALKNVMLNEEVDVKVINLLTSYAKAIGYNDTLFVSSAGDNSNGSSWEKAYNSITTALDWVAANQSSGEIHLIMVGVGTFDVNTTGDPTYDENIVIVGTGRDKTILTNTHASATSVLKCTGIIKIFNLTVNTGSGTADGILINGTSINGFVLENVLFNGMSATGAHDLIKIDGSVVHGRITNARLLGVVANTTALHLDGCSYARFSDLEFGSSLIAIHLDNAGDDNNLFDDIIINGCTTGIQIDVAGATNNHIVNPAFTSCTTNISDSGTATIFYNVTIKPKPSASVSPADLTGVTLTAGVGANIWGAAIAEIRSAAAATKPFFITGIVFEPDTIEKYGLRLSDDGGTTYFWEGILEAFAAAINRSQRVLFVEKFFIPQGSQISGLLKSETGGNTLDIWLKIEVI